VRRALLSLAVAVALAGCGNDRTPPPGALIRPTSGGFRPVAYPKHGLSLRIPLRWRVEPGEGDRVTTLAAGNGQISVWRFARREPLPVSRTQLSGRAHDGAEERGARHGGRREEVAFLFGQGRRRDESRLGVIGGRSVLHLVARFCFCLAHERSPGARLVIIERDASFRAAYCVRGCAPRLASKGSA